jgi:hypothetical protein
MLLAGAVSSYGCSGGDTLGEYGNGPNHTPQEIASFYYDKETEIQQKLLQANIEYTNDKKACKANATGCMNKAQRKFQKAQYEILTRRNENNCQRSMWEIDNEAQSDIRYVLGNGATPFEREENSRHFDALIGIKKKTVDENTNFENEKISCKMDDKGQGCVEDAETKHAAALAALKEDLDNENAMHLIAVRRGEQRPSRRSAGGTVRDGDHLQKRRPRFGHKLYPTPRGWPSPEHRSRAATGA